RATDRSALDDQHRLRVTAHGGERLDDVGVAARDVEFLDRADHEIELRQQALQMRRYGVRTDVTRFAVTTLGEPPQDRTIVDVEDRAHIMLPCAIERKIADAVDVFSRKMCPGQQERSAPG